jgi:hypothetical protein
MPEWTTVNIDKPVAKRLRKLAIDAEQDIREAATEAVEAGIPILRERLSRRNNTTTPQQTPVLNKP